jgi:hypothetical protein
MNDEEAMAAFTQFFNVDGELIVPEEQTTTLQQQAVRMTKEPERVKGQVQGAPQAPQAEDTMVSRPMADMKLRDRLRRLAAKRAS